MLDPSEVGERTLNKAVRMRSVRCDACGTKALMAASQCPKCSHLFEVRDGFGELLPLSYCSSCDSYYPATAGECRWCGTKPEAAPNHAFVWKRVGAASLVVLAGLAWMMRDSRPDRRPKTAAHARVAAQPIADSSYTALDTMGSMPAPLPVLTPVETVVAVGPRVTTASSGNVVRRSAPAVDPSDAAVPQSAPRSIAAAIPPDRPSARSTPATASKSRTSSRWVNSIARSWVVVRVDARKDSRIVASIGPDTHIQLGESRGTWRRIKARGIAGWVETRSSFAAARSSTKAGGMAAR